MQQLPRVPLQPDRDTNRLWRARVKKLWADPLALGDNGAARRVQQQLRKLCADDFHFFHNTYCWAFDEHTPGIIREFPLVEYEFQRDYADVLINHVWRAAREKNYRWNGGADKCRKMVATSTALDVFSWFAQFHGISTIITSKTEDDCDIPENLDTPFEKIRWQLRQLPEFLFPDNFNFNDKQMNKTRLINFQNGGRLTGIAPSGKAARQGRGLIWYGDEFGFVEGTDEELWDAMAMTVKVRFVTSTPNGPHCKYYRVITNADGDNATVIELDWWQHPDYAEGLYLKNDGTLSSPWFDEFCANNSRQVVAREILRDHNDAVGGRIFGMFSSLSAAPQIIRVNKEVYCAVDPGGQHFAGVFGNKDDNRIMRYYNEVAVNDEDAQNADVAILDKASEELLAVAKSEFKGYEIYYIGDPNSGVRKGPQEKETDYQKMWRKYKIKVISSFFFRTPSKERVESRITELRDLMSSWVETPDGLRPKMLVDSEGAPKLLLAFKGRYRRRVMEDGTVLQEIKKDRPYTDLVDCAGYLAIYLDDERHLTRGGRPKIAKRGTKWKPSGRGRFYGGEGRFSAR